MKSATKAEDFMRGRKAIHDHIKQGNLIPETWIITAEKCIEDDKDKAFYQGVLITIGTLPLFYKQYAKEYKI